MVAVRVAEPEILTIDEVADWLKVHRSTIYRMMHDKSGFPGFKLGSDWRFHAPTVEKWINEKMH